MAVLYLWTEFCKSISGNVFFCSCLDSFNFIYMLFFSQSVFIFLQVLLGLVFPFILPIIKFTPREREGGKQMEQQPDAASSKANPKNQVSPHKRHPEDPEDTSDTDFIRSKSRRKHRRPRVTQKMYRVDLCGCCSVPNSINLWKAMYYFHTTPLVKFLYHTVSIRSIDTCKILYFWL